MSIPVASLRDTTRLTGCTANDAVVAAICTALRDELAQQGEYVRRAKVWIPVSDRTTDVPPLVGNLGATLRMLEFDVNESCSGKQFYLSIVEKMLAAKEDPAVEAAGRLLVEGLGHLPAPLIRRISAPHAVNRVSNALVSSLRIDPTAMAVEGTSPSAMFCFGAIQCGLSWVVVPLRARDDIFISFTADASQAPLIDSMCRRLSGQAS